MRPVVLDMNGFAAFREPATVDFTDADFFALTGPTGSGKSTVIDAMTFALYGSVPRWGRKGMVSLALAPTTARGTVKLVFEVSGQRYAVARELRRAGNQVHQRAASLERLAGPDARAGPGEQTEVLAKDPAGVASAVERLLGLSYEDFCQCVVLPQGQFASFLHAKAGERQEILLRLLGAEHYRQMMARANQRAGDAAKRAETLDETLATFGDATKQAQDAADAAQQALEQLSGRVAAALPQIVAAAGELAAAEAELARLEQDRNSLAAVRIPGDVAALDADLAAARTALDQARAAEEQAADADTAARAALAGAPQRAPLELARQRRTEMDQRSAAVPALRAEVARLSALSRQAEGASAAAAGDLETLRAQRDNAARAAGEAEQRAAGLSVQHTVLTSVAVPAGVAELDQRQDAASAAAQQALATLQAAEQADGHARAARESATRAAPLEQARRDLRDLADLTAAITSAQARLDQARRRKVAADAAQSQAEAERERRQRSLDEARRAGTAAGLRPHLVPGGTCPVCQQTVTAIPAPLPAAAIDEAQAGVDQAAVALAAAQRAARDAADGDVRAAAEADALSTQRRRLAGSLAAAQAGPLAGAGLPALSGLVAGAEDGTERLAAALAEVEAGLRAWHALDAAANAAAAAMASARVRARCAQAALDAARAEMGSARAVLREARDPLVGLGAPPAEAASLAAAWAELATWAGQLARARAAELAGAGEAAQAAAREREKAQALFDQAEADLAQLRADASSAGRAEQEARTRLAGLTDRVAELGRLLHGAPDDAAITAQLALRDELEAAAACAEQRLLGARSARSRAQLDLARLDRAEAAARAGLSAARDPLVQLGAPVLDAAGLLAGWTKLQAWAASEAAACGRQLEPARNRVATARAGRHELTSALRTDLAACGLELAPEAEAAGAATTVAAALERARGVTRRVAERRAEAAELAARRDAATGEHQVARLLGDLLRSDRFPRWLVTAAVDGLVAEASVNLAALSNGQFDLTHDGGEFYVVDHADADSRRSVRTLSGGETFQASLALALALSSQMSTLAAAGAARLDSIFLDEGFGTLDPETLEVVATTLETLAQGQRMVGVITHVAALAERVPVRFAVSRTARTSRVQRQGLPSPGDAAGPGYPGAAA